jgi:putative toxin-antitoxin system antitoxin component (TIGR02293 family)
MVHAIVDALGGRKAVAGNPATAADWADRIVSGLPVPSAVAFKALLQLTNDQLARLLGVTARTLARWNPSGGRLDPVASDRLYRAARVFSMAAEVLEDAEKAIRWLKSPQTALGGRIPLDFIETDAGTRAVEALLGRMEYSVYS